MITNSRSISTGVSWGGALFGLAVGLFSYLVMLMIGVALAGQSFDFQNMSELGWGALIWAAVAVAISGYVAGYTGARGSAGPVSRRSGMCTGALAGVLMVLLLTVFTLNSIASAGKAAFGVVQSAAGAVTEIPAGRIMESSGLPERTGRLLEGFDRGEVERLIAENSPTLNQQQVSAAASTVEQSVSQAFQRVRATLSNPSQIGTVIDQQVDFLTQELTGAQFTNRLTQQGLTPPQAQEVTNTVGQRVTEVQNQIRELKTELMAQVEGTSEAAADVISKGAGIWLMFALLLVLLSTLGGTAARDLRSEEEADLLHDDDDDHTFVDKNSRMQQPHH